MSLKSLIVVAVLVPAVGLAQTVTPPVDFTPPPMVPAAPPPMPPADPSAPAAQPGTQPGTPPPPSTNPLATPTKSAYPYSPYGTPRVQEKPGPEIGLMVSEALFGSLTAAGVTVLPYFLLFASGQIGDPTLSSIIFCLIFGAAPLAVAQTQVSLANGSRFYQTEMWIPALVGLAGEAAVLGIFYATGWLPTGQASGGVPNGGSVAWLMIGAIGLVPLLQMGAINLFKTPKQNFAMIGNPDKGLGVAFAPPTAAPILAPSASGTQLGVAFSFLRGRF
jgi:hypothetical protein